MKPELLLPARVAAFLINLVLLYVLLVSLTGRLVPVGGEQDLWFVCSIGYLTYYLFSTPFFVPPSQALASGMPAALLLLTLDLRQVGYLRGPLEWIRWGGFAAAVVTSATAGMAILLRGSGRGSLEGPARRVAMTLGRAGVMFTPPALISVFGFNQDSPERALWISLFWVALVTIQPVELLLGFAQDYDRATGASVDSQRIGEIQRIDSPNVARVELAAGATWSGPRAHVCVLPDGSQAHLVPLYTQVQGAALVGTGLINKGSVTPLAGGQPAGVYSLRQGPANADIVEQLAGSPGCELVGFVVEDSRIGTIQFEVATEEDLSAGRLVFCRKRGQNIYYQVLDARTREESFEKNPHGTHVVSAAQLGTLTDIGFTAYGWLPEMNAPVFTCDRIAPGQQPAKPVGTFLLGTLPSAGVEVRARFRDLAEFHTAILGVTGTGKTEMALTVIRQGLDEGVKVFCVDFTGEYAPRLADREPVSLGFSTDRMAELRKLVDAIETGQFKSEAEKRKLEEWDGRVRPEVARAVGEFLEKTGAALGIFDLPEIANSRATLRATELYLSAIFEWARQHRRRERILVVLEEAHTVIPEMGLYSFDKGETQSVVGRIAQIALQGRKYGVGLLLVSQRTASVSKSLLSQCNSFLVFALHDKTSLDYLQNVFGQEHVGAMPRLAFRHGIAFGKGILSHAPVLFEVPDDPKKREASEALDHGPEPTSPAPVVT